jgi:hypothetical protein
LAVLVAWVETVQRRARRIAERGNQKELLYVAVIANYLWFFNHLQVDAIFFQRLKNILRIVIPGLHSKEALLLLMHSSLLILRTAISLYVAALDGRYGSLLTLPISAFNNYSGL